LVFGLSDGLIGNGLDTIQVVEQFAHPLARLVGVGALGRLLKGGSNVGNIGEVRTLDGLVPTLNLTIPPLAAIFLVPES
jgi:hypothetical protein